MYRPQITPRLITIRWVLCIPWIYQREWLPGRIDHPWQLRAKELQSEKTLPVVIVPKSEFEAISEFDGKRMKKGGDFRCFTWKLQGYIILYTNTIPFLLYTPVSGSLYNVSAPKRQSYFTYSENQVL